jgi:hypothetical protein
MRYFLFAAKWPLGHLTHPQSQPYKHRLECKARRMIPPGHMLAADCDVIDRMVDIRWKNANSICGKGNASSKAQPGYEGQRHSTRNLAQTGYLYDLFRVGHPGWRNL